MSLGLQVMDAGGTQLIESLGGRLVMRKRGVLGLLTLLLLVVYGPGHWQAEVPIVAMAALGLGIESLRESRVFWGVLVVCMIVSMWPHYYVQDNHKFLMIYWVGLLATAITSEPTLQRSARWLLVLVFGFAAGWKIVSSSFMSGDFLHYSLLCDPRFRAFTAILTGTPHSVLDSNWGAESSMQLDGAGEVAIGGGASAMALAQVMTWWTIFVESGIAIACAAHRLHPMVKNARNLLLVVFMLSTYPVAPVIGFGWLLCIIGMAQCGREEVKWTMTFMVAFVVLQLFTIPFPDLVGLG